jgi:prevent-host-death family protein
MDDEARSRPKKINAMEARRNFGANLEIVYYSGAQFIIERAGKPMAALVPITLLEEWQNRSSPAETRHDTGKGNKRQSRKGKA